MDRVGIVAVGSLPPSGFSFTTTIALAMMCNDLLILIALFIWLPVGELWQSVQGVSWLLWLACWAAFVLGHVGGSFKWSLLIGVDGPPLARIPQDLREPRRRGLTRSSPDFSTR